MPRYYFDVENGRPTRDDHGHELPDPETARAEAAVMMGEMLRDRGGAFWDWGRLRVIVRDEESQRVAVLVARDETPDA